MEQSGNFLINCDGDVVFDLTNGALVMSSHVVKRMCNNPGDYEIDDSNVVEVHDDTITFPDGTIIYTREVLAALG